jgi:hypothetical protein
MKLVASVAAVVLGLAIAAPAVAQQPAPAPTLYKRLGGYDSLDELNVPAKEKTEVLTAISGLKKDIVEKP